MDKKIQDLLNGKTDNHLAPFFWQHGENESVLRKYMAVIEASGCRSVCVESRPHPDFCGPKWWEDMDIILDEARKREMKVWILDDSHFPTGYANGVLEKTNDYSLFRQSVFSNLVDEPTHNHYHVLIDDYVKPPKLELSLLADIATKMTPPPTGLGKDEFISVVAVSGDNCLDLSDKIENGVLDWIRPDGSWKVYVNGLTRNAGAHRTYINMLLKDSCRLLIDEVYEKHYEHYSKDFGKTIAGFFSDEPELGNGIIYMQNNPLGTQQDLPWSKEVEDILNEKFANDWRRQLPLLWTGTGSQEASNFRYHYMNIVSHLVEKNFSHQISEWCHKHDVQYIGHIIEDEGQHCRTGSSLGHYFRGLSGQDMAGIDDIGGQVFPGGEDGPNIGPLERTRNGEFYHYGLASLAASAAAIEPHKKGRAMCEIFGNYGWKEGVKLEKYLADHFLVRGINFFVPHAFSPKSYPDPDCPPHFYAHGHNPQYRHFGKLMSYMNRLSDLFSGGVRKVTAAVLYHGESEWSGSAMPFEKVSRVLMDNQINSDVIPADVFENRADFKTKISKRKFSVNTQDYQIFIVPEADFVPKEVLVAVEELMAADLPVVFINKVPKSCTGELFNINQQAVVITLEELVPYIEAKNLTELKISPSNNRIRIMHYYESCDKYMLVNEGEEVYRGKITLPSTGKCYRYDAYENCLEKIEYQENVKTTELDLILEPLHSQVIVFDDVEDEKLNQPLIKSGQEVPLVNWVRSQCSAIDYPKFKNETIIQLPDNLAEEQKDFSGFIRYTTSFELLEETKEVILSITDTGGGVEVFVNGHSLGIQLTAPCLFDISSTVKKGKNELVIEVATTLERERYYADDMTIFEKAMVSEPEEGTGIIGQVSIFKK